MDKIFIKDLVARGKHGVSDEERAREQEFALDIEIEFDTHAAAASDALEDTIDYNILRDAAKETVEGPSFILLERLADAVAREILEDVHIRQVLVTVRKTEMFADCMPGVTIVRTRA